MARSAAHRNRGATGALTAVTPLLLDSGFDTRQAGMLRHATR